MNQMNYIPLKRKLQHEPDELYPPYTYCA